MQTDHREIDPPTEDATGANRVLDAAFAFWRAALLLSADELGLFAALAKGAPDVPSVGARLGIAGEAAADLLDALAQLGLVERRGDGFSNAAASSTRPAPHTSGAGSPWRVQPCTKRPISPND